MGCVSSKPDINDRHPNIFQVTNVNDQGKSISSGQLEVTENELVLYQRNKEPTVWPLRSLRKYGFDAGIFSFECGRRCPTGQGIYAFHCRKAEQLFNIVQHNIQRNSNDETITTTAAGGGSNNASSTAQQQMAAQTGGGDFPVPQNSTGPPVISRRSIPASMTTTVSQQQQQQQQQTGPEVYLSPVAAVVNSVRPTPIPPAAAHSQQQQQHPILSRPGSMIANNAGSCGGANSPTSVVAMTTATTTVISPPPTVLIGGNGGGGGCNNNNTNNNNNNNSTNNNLMATATQQLHFTGTTTTIPSSVVSSSTVINDTNNDVSLLPLTTEHNNNINPSSNNNKKSLVSVAPSVLPAPELYHHQYTNTAGVLSGGILSSSLSYFDVEESLSSPPPLHQNAPSSPPTQPALIQQPPQQVNYANLGLTNAIVIASSTNNSAHNGTATAAAGGVVLNEDYMNMLDSPCHVYMNVETGGGVAGTNSQTTHLTKEPLLTALPTSSTNFSNNGMVETRDLLVLNGGSKEKMATGNHVKETMQEPIMAELKSEPEEYELEDDTPSHSYANIDAKDFEHLRPLLLSHRNNSLAVDSMMGFASSSALPGLMTNSGSSSNSVPQTPTSLYNVTTSQMGSCHQEYYSTGISATNQHEVNYAELDLDCKNHNFFAATTKSLVGHSMTSQDHQDFPSSPVLLTQQKSPDGPFAPEKIEQKKSYATIDFQKTNALSQSVNPHNVDIIEEGSRKTRHNSTISDVTTTSVATTGGGRHSSSLSD